MKVAILLCQVYSHFYLFLHLKKHLDGQCHNDEELIKRSHYVVTRAGGVVLWNRNTKTCSRLNICLDNGSKYLKVCVKFFYIILFMNI